MLNQSSYGRMDETPKPVKGGAVNVPCARCKCLFSLEKVHKHLFSQTMYYARTKEGTLAPATPKDIEMFNLCINCFNIIKTFIMQQK